MNLAIDTIRYRDFCDNDPVALDCLQTADHITLPFVSVAELRAGFLCGTRARENEQVLTRFLNRPRVSALFPSEPTVRHYAQLFYQLRQQGTPIPTNDIWVAALVLENDLVLFSRDRHFDHLPQLSRVSGV